jgi:hypothetical protein
VGEGVRLEVAVRSATADGFHTAQKYAHDNSRRISTNIAYGDLRHGWVNTGAR